MSRYREIGLVEVDSRKRISLSRAGVKVNPGDRLIVQEGTDGTYRLVLAEVRPVIQTKNQA